MKLNEVTARRLLFFFEEEDNVDTESDKYSYSILPFLISLVKQSKETKL